MKQPLYRLAQLIQEWKKFSRTSTRAAKFRNTAQKRNCRSDSASYKKFKFEENFIQIATLPKKSKYSFEFFVTDYAINKIYDKKLRNGNLLHKQVHAMQCDCLWQIKMNTKVCAGLENSKNLHNCKGHAKNASAFELFKFSDYSFN